MAVITMEGTIEIDLADVWGWLDAAGHTKGEDFESLFFSQGRDQLVLRKAADAEDSEPVHVDAAEFWAWVLDKQMPRGMGGFETVFGVPAVSPESYSLAITFAASNDSDPRSWAEPPKCMKEWDREPPSTGDRPQTGAEIDRRSQ